MKELRPHLATETEFVERWRRQRAAGYRLLGLWCEEKLVALAGFRVIENLVHGMHLYVDDLVTLEEARGCGPTGRNCCAGCARRRGRVGMQEAAARYAAGYCAQAPVLATAMGCWRRCDLAWFWRSEGGRRGQFDKWRKEINSPSYRAMLETIFLAIGELLGDAVWYALWWAFGWIGLGVIWSLTFGRVLDESRRRRGEDIGSRNGRVGYLSPVFGGVRLLALVGVAGRCGTMAWRQSGRRCTLRRRLPGGNRREGQNSHRHRRKPGPFRRRPGNCP